MKYHLSILHSFFSAGDSCISGLFNFCLFSSIWMLIISIKRIVDEIDKANEHPTIIRQIPTI